MSKNQTNNNNCSNKNRPNEKESGRSLEQNEKGIHASPNQAGREGVQKGNQQQQPQRGNQPHQQQQQKRDDRR